MNLSSLSDWLKTTIPGIIILGAAGSLVAVWLGKFILPFLIRGLRLPVTFYQGQRRYQAFVLGFSHAAIEEDSSGRRLATFLTYHLAKFMFFTSLALVGWLSFLLLALFTTYPAFTYAGFVSVVVALLSLYRANYEFRFIDRYFLEHWGMVLVRADDRIREWRVRGGLPSDIEKQQLDQVTERVATRSSDMSGGVEPPTATDASRR